MALLIIGGVTTASLTDPQMTGWMMKQGHIYKSWKKRLFVLKGPFLWYFAEEGQVWMIATSTPSPLTLPAIRKP